MELLHDLVLIKELPRDEVRTAGGLIVPGSATRFCVGVVRYAGPGAPHEGQYVAVAVQPGDKVAYMRSGQLGGAVAMPGADGDEQLDIIRYEDVLWVVARSSERPDRAETPCGE